MILRFDTLLHLPDFDYFTDFSKITGLQMFCPLLELISGGSYLFPDTNFAGRQVSDSTTVLQTHKLLPAKLDCLFLCTLASIARIILWIRLLVLFIGPSSVGLKLHADRETKSHGTNGCVCVQISPHVRCTHTKVQQKPIQGCYRETVTSIFAHSCKTA